MLNEDSIVLLGLPIDTLTIDQTVQHARELIKQFKTEHHPSYISTVNTDFLSKVHGWNPSHSKNPELIRILRNTTISVADGMPLIWLSKCLQDPLPERVTGSDLFPKLARMLNEQEGSLFLLGGEKTVTDAAVEKLKKQYPRLTISGTANPYIYVEGERLEKAEEQDNLILEVINQAQPDLLVLNLGNPKQEIWFDRVKRRLQVPLSIGIGGGLAFYTNQVPRAPLWMQKSGLEWLFRLTYEPRRLWKRYFIASINFLYCSVPLCLYHHLNNLFFNLTKKHEHPSIKNLLFLSKNRSIAIVSLPKNIDQQVAANIRKKTSDAFSQDVVVLDFKHTRQIDLKGLSLLMNIAQRAALTHKEFYSINLSLSFRNLLKLHRIWDMLKDSYLKYPEELLTSINHHETRKIFYHTIEQTGEYVILSFLGHLRNNYPFDKYLDKLKPILSDKDCLLDLSYCTLIENAGITFLLQLRKYQQDKGKRLMLTGLSKEVKHELDIAQASQLFTILP